MMVPTFQNKFHHFNQQHPSSPLFQANIESRLRQNLTAMPPLTASNMTSAAPISPEALYSRRILQNLPSHGYQANLSHFLRMGATMEQQQPLLMQRLLAQQQLAQQQLRAVSPTSQILQKLLQKEGSQINKIKPVTTPADQSPAPSPASPTKGLDLLFSVASEASEMKPMEVMSNKVKKQGEGTKKTRQETSDDDVENSLMYVDKASELDVLCGRGGRSNHHPGNKRYRQVVSEMKQSYKTIGSKSAKTDLSRAIVDHVYSYGGRFLKLDKSKGKYYVLSVNEGRKKTSQALREAKVVKWTV